MTTSDSFEVLSINPLFVVDQIIPSINWPSMFHVIFKHIYPVITRLLEGNDIVEARVSIGLSRRLELSEGLLGLCTRGNRQ